MATISANLGKNLGGTWKYDGTCAWHCDDGKRSVWRCSLGVDQFDDPIPGCAYYLYDGLCRGRAEQYIGKTRYTAFVAFTPKP